jgi:hypothetical protein
MRLPNADHVIVSAEKLRDYILSPSHTVGARKAVAFAAAGYRQDNWWRLRQDLKRLACTREAEGLNLTIHGRKFVVRGTLDGPLRALDVVTIWIVLRRERFPRFVTAYPERL